MKVPLSWLREYAPTDLEARALGQRLAMTGTEVERVTTHGVAALEHFVVGRVLSAEQHPDADRLKVCMVDIGDGEPKQIVCGAPNVAAGQTVGVARPGSVMPDGTKLKAAKLRGVVSDGMILAEDEVGIGTDHAGTMVLDDALAVGSPLHDAVPIADEVLELEITPNRPDCLGIYGVAREVHAATATALRPPPWASDDHPPGDEIDGVSIEVRCPDLCPRFTARVFTDVTIGPSPRWLKARLMAAGQRPISNVVDITNYVMLLTGQPLHAFDLDRVEGHTLVIRRADDGEDVETLDGQTRTLTSADIVIDDAHGPTSIAGVMGGARSEVSDATTRVLMEVATWDGPTINRTSTRLGLRSEASGRFEKGLAPEQCLDAQAVAAKLMVELCGATPLAGTVDVGGPGPDAAVIRLRERRVESLLGAPVAPEQQRAILNALGFDTDPRNDGLDVTVPYWRRNDVTREADVIEEVARIDGVDELPTTLPPRRAVRAAGLTHAQRVRRRAEDVLIGCGLYEIAGWSFTEPAVLDRLRLAANSPMRDVVVIENPMSSAQSVMRPSILGSLLDAAAHNIARDQRDLALFESGGVYRNAAGPNGDGDTARGPASGGHVAALRTPQLADEHHALAALLCARDGADFFAIKGVLAAVLDAVRVDWSVSARSWPFLHPGASAGVQAGDELLGFVGVVHPLVARAWDIEQGTAAFAIDVGKLAAAAPEVTRFADLPAFPAVKRDLSLSLDEATAAGDLVATIERAGGKLLEQIEIFDVYSGQQAGEGRTSIALHLEFRAADRTLSDDEVDRLMEKIRAAAGELGATLRA
jgi:phenylalanyl-tRNA synthetase beta chain